METYHYSNDEYDLDIKELISKLNNIKNLHLIAVYRGSIKIVEDLSKELNCNTSTIKFQTRDGNDETPEFLINNIKESDDLVVIEDIYDSGTTIKEIKKMMDQKYPKSKVNYMTIFGLENDDEVEYLHHKKDRWIKFFWED